MSTPNAAPTEDKRVPDHEFIAALRAAIERYLAAVDAWEAAYQKYYRLPGYASKITEDLAQEHQDYRARRSELKNLLPRARRLCFRHGLREPFSGLLMISLGEYAPQERMDSAIGRNERTVVAKALIELDSACHEWSQEKSEGEPERERSKASLLQRFLDFFY